MTDIPIIMSSPMVRALLAEAQRAGSGKTQTRRVLKNAPLEPIWHCDRRSDGWVFVPDGGVPSIPARVRFAVGDRLWVKEAFAEEPIKAQRGFHPALVDYWFKATDSDAFAPELKWASARYMPKAASRLTLLVTDVRVQRLQNISEADAAAEGILHSDVWREDMPLSICYSVLWDRLNAKRGFSWLINPFVVALTFSVIRANIADLPAGPQ